MRRIAETKNTIRLSWVACRITILFSLIGSLTGCGWVRDLRPSNDRWLRDGSLAISRPVPAPGLRSDGPGLASLKPEFTAEQPTNPSTTLIISRRDRTLTAFRPDAAPLVIKTEGAQHLPTGSFSVMNKEQNPLWYAPREYFTNRSLPVPSEGSRARFRRAALGQRTLYLSNQTPIHSGPVWLREIGGLRVNDSEMVDIYSMVSVGTRVEIR